MDISSATKFFFDREKVQNALDKGTARVLSKFGAFVRTRAQRSLRTRKQASAPGSPPSSHEGSLKKFLFFTYEPTAKTVVIGPVLRRTVFGSKTVPQLMEEGGTVGAGAGGRTVLVRRKPGREAGTGRFVAGGFDRVRVAGGVKYPARPFMKPAFDAELKGKLASLLTDFIGGGSQS